MKRKEMEQHMQDGTEVAVASYLSGNPPHCQLAKITDLGQTRRVYSGARWDFTGHPVHDGVAVEYADGRTDVVGPRNVYATWAEYEEQRDRSQQARETRQSALDASKARASAAVTKACALLPDAPYGSIEIAPLGGFSGSPISGWTVRIAPSQLEALLAQVAPEQQIEAGIA